MAIQDNVNLITKQFPKVVGWVKDLAGRVKELEETVSSLQKRVKELEQSNKEKTSVIVGNPPFNSDEVTKKSSKKLSKTVNEVVDESSIIEQPVTVIIEPNDSMSVDVNPGELQTETVSKEMKETGEIAPEEPKETTEEIVEETQSSVNTTTNSRKSRRGR